MQRKKERWGGGSWRIYIWHVIKAHFALGVKANVQLKSSIPIGAKLEIRSQGLKLNI